MKFVKRCFENEIKLKKKKRHIVTFNAKQRAENLGKLWQCLKFMLVFDVKMLKIMNIMKIMQSGTPEYVQYINN